MSERFEKIKITGISSKTFHEHTRLQHCPFEVYWLLEHVIILTKSWISSSQTSCMMYCVGVDMKEHIETL